MVAKKFLSVGLIILIVFISGCSFFEGFSVYRQTTQERAIAAGDPSICDGASHPDVCKAAVKRSDSVDENCGEYKEPCCEKGDPCPGPDYLICEDGICVSCGMENDHCCKDNGGEFCNGYHRCKDGVCIDCGIRGLSCSEEEPCCDEFTCKGGTCITDDKCGMVNEPCCEGTVKCLHRSLVECRDGTCQFKSEEAEEEYMNTMNGSEEHEGSNIGGETRGYGSAIGARG